MLIRICVCIVFFLPLMIIAETKEELRAVKIADPWNSPVMTSDKSIADAMDLLASININVVLPAVWNRAYTVFRSKIMDSLFQRPINPVVTGRDPLGMMIIEAHRNGIEVVPWFEYGFSSWNSSLGSNDPIRQAYPEWALIDYTGEICQKNDFFWMSPINPEVQDFILGITMEACRNYDIDGVEYSDRIPSMPVEGGYDSVTIDIYKSEHNGAVPPVNYLDTGWKRWRADKMNAWYQQVRDSIKFNFPNIEVCSSPNSYPWAYDEYLQDVKTWVDNRIIDNCVPQMYRTNISEYTYEIDRFNSNFSFDQRKIFFSGILAKLGSYVIDTALLYQQITANRNKGINGEALFYYEAITANTNRIANFLRQGVYAEPAINPGRYGAIWRPKAVVVNEDDSIAVQKNGNWVSKSTAGFKSGIIHTSDAQYASIMYTFSIPFTAYFHVYAFGSASPNYSQKSPYTIYSKSDSVTVYVNQTNSLRWVDLGSYYLEKGTQKLVKLDNNGIEANKYVMADAIMIMIDRKKSPEVLVNIDDQWNKTTLPLSNPVRWYTNYPNPFNGVTTITFYLPFRSTTMIHMYDITGKEVYKIADRWMESGRHQIQVDVQGCASGIYFCRLEACGQTVIGKLMLIK